MLGGIYGSGCTGADSTVGAAVSGCGACASAPALVYAAAAANIANWNSCFMVVSPASPFSPMRGFIVQL
jgi:hypothetical protein